MARLGAFEKKLKDYQKRLKNLSRVSKLTMKDLLTARFLKKCSKFKSLKELIAASSFRIDSEAAIGAIPTQWDDFIRANTTYSGWEQMRQAAASEWIEKHLG